jgi:hypothetical protein
MVVPRCTRKLLARLKRTDVSADIVSSTRLGDWYGNILQIGHRQHLLSSATDRGFRSLSRFAKHLEAVFPDAVCDVLAAVGIGAEDIATSAGECLKSRSGGRTIAACWER